MWSFFYCSTVLNEWIFSFKCISQACWCIFVIVQLRIIQLKHRRFSAVMYISLRTIFFVYLLNDLRQMFLAIFSYSYLHEISCRESCVFNLVLEQNQTEMAEQSRSLYIIIKSAFWCDVQYICFKMQLLFKLCGHFLSEMYRIITWDICNSCINCFTKHLMQLAQNALCGSEAEWMKY